MHVWTNATNLGDYPNRNKAASYATGKYLKYLDADDLLYPQSLATFVWYMDHYPEAALGVSSYVVAHASPFPLHFPPGAAFHYHFFTQGFLDCEPSGTIIRRETFAAQGGFSGKRMVGDTELWMKIAAAHLVILVPPGLFFWQQHAGQESTAGEQRGVFLALTLPMIQEALQLSRGAINGGRKTAGARVFPPPHRPKTPPASGEEQADQRSLDPLPASAAEVDRSLACRRRSTVAWVCLPRVGRERESRWRGRSIPPGGC